MFSLVLLNHESDARAENSNFVSSVLGLLDLLSTKKKNTAEKTSKAWAVITVAEQLCRQYMGGGGRTEAQLDSHHVLHRGSSMNVAQNPSLRDW